MDQHNLIQYIARTSAVNYVIKVMSNMSAKQSNFR